MKHKEDYINPPVSFPERDKLLKSKNYDRAGSADVRSIPDEYSDLPIPKDIDLPENLQYSDLKKMKIKRNQEMNVQKGKGDSAWMKKKL